MQHCMQYLLRYLNEILYFDIAMLYCKYTSEYWTRLPLVPGDIQNQVGGGSKLKWSKLKGNIKDRHTETILPGVHVN